MSSKQYRWVTREDVQRLKEILDENSTRSPPLSARQLIAAWGKDEATFYRYRFKLEQNEPITYIDPPVRGCTGVVKELFEHLMDSQGKSQAEIARRVGVTPNAVRYWHSGEHLPSSFNLECLAQLAGFKLGLLPQAVGTTKEGQ